MLTPDTTSVFPASFKLRPAVPWLSTTYWHIDGNYPFVSITIEGGKIVAATWDEVYNGGLKSELSTTGKYVIPSSRNNLAALYRDAYEWVVALLVRRCLFLVYAVLSVCLCNQLVN